MRLGGLDGFDERLNPLLYRRDDFLAARAFVAKRVLRQRRAQARQHAVVINDQAKILARIDPVRPRDGLHQRVRLQPLSSFSAHGAPRTHQIFARSEIGHRTVCLIETLKAYLLPAARSGQVCTRQ